ncbi:thioesterase, partial [Escherichia coli]|nr:thioesterase [Escherichia coli]
MYVLIYFSMIVTKEMVIITQLFTHTQ